jgi:hypothetical protein
VPTSREYDMHVPRITLEEAKNLDPLSDTFLHEITSRNNLARDCTGWLWASILNAEAEELFLMRETARLKLIGNVYDT